MYTIDNYCSIDIFVNKSRKIKFKWKLKLHMIGGNFLAVKNRDLEHGLKNKYVYEVPEVNFLLKHYTQTFNCFTIEIFFPICDPENVNF